MDLSLSEKIKILISRQGMTLSAFARKIDMSPQNFSKMLKTNTMTVSSLQRIAEGLGCTLSIEFKESETV